MREIEWRLHHRNRPYGSRDLRAGRIAPPPPAPHQLTRAPLGGMFCPPLEYLRLLENYVRYRHQIFSTLLDINSTPCLKILSNLVGKFLRK